MKKILFFLSLFLLYNLKLFSQQEVTFSQYMFNNLLVNPAYAGYKEDINVSLLNRNQWVGINGAPVTQSVIIDGAFFNNNNVGLGLAIMNDKIGIQAQTSALLNYAYRLPVGYNEARLSFGIGVGATQYSLLSNNAYVNDINDVNLGNNQHQLLPDARIGVYYNNEKFYAGFSINNLLTQTLNKNKSTSSMVALPPVHMFLTAGAIFDVNNFLKFKPSLMLRDDPKSIGNLDVNASFLINDFLWLGGSYRMSVDMWKNSSGFNGSFQQNSLVGLVEVYVARNIRIGYAYDYGLSSLNSVSSGSHELSVGLTIGKGYKNSALTTPRYF